MQKKDDIRCTKEFRKRRTRQLVAVSVTVFVVLLSAFIHKRPDIFGDSSRSGIFAAQAISIAVFIGFTSVNWRCPSCGRHLGSDINRSRCAKCGARLR